MPSRSLAAAVAFSLSTLPAFADGEVFDIMTSVDKARLDAFEKTRAEALAEAREGGAPEDVAALDQIVHASPQPWDDLDITGDWQCRTIKAGGAAKLVVYGWFRCSVITDIVGEWEFEKVSGSQRTKGSFYTDSDTRWIYLGSYFTPDETPKPYGSGPETDQVGYAFRSGDAAWRIEFSAPVRESKFDILELRQ